MDDRRKFLKQSIGLAALPALGSTSVKRQGGVRLKIALNAYSFNKPLTAGQMKLPDLVDFCAAHDIDGLDATGYYFPGYPEVPTDEYVYELKRKAYMNGVTISGTGVRNDFALPDAAARKGQIKLVKDWVVVAEKLGAGFIRVFSGREVPKGHSFDQVLDWMVPAFRECADFAQHHGVIIGLQHHDDFLKTADETIRVVEAVGSPWFSVVLDVGSFRQKDAYEEIEKLLPYACTWQIKENVWAGGKLVPIDLAKIRAIIEKVGYRGFLPIEALGQGDQKQIVTAFLDKVRKAMAG